MYANSEKAHLELIRCKAHLFSERRARLFGERRAHLFGERGARLFGEGGTPLFGKIILKGENVSPTKGDKKSPFVFYI